MCSPPLSYHQNDPVRLFVLRVVKDPHVTTEDDSCVEILWVFQKHMKVPLVRFIVR